MVLIIDNYDSFTYNLVQRLGELNASWSIEVLRNDAITVDEVLRKKPVRVIISPGPCTPNEAGISVDLSRAIAGKIPLLGVCLGHQAMIQAFGGSVSRADRLMHGKTSQIYHDGLGVYAGLPNPFVATRYHSLIVRREDLPDEFEVTAWTDRDELMGVRHRDLAMEGVQFHPESFLTDRGRDMLQNFMAPDWPGRG